MGQKEKMKITAVISLKPGENREEANDKFARILGALFAGGIVSDWRIDFGETAIPENQAAAEAPKTTKVKVSLSDRAPVLISIHEWPHIAYVSKSQEAWEFQVATPTTTTIGYSGETIEISAIIVRRNKKDGRFLVYGWRDIQPKRVPKPCRDIAAGYLLPADADPEYLAAIIRTVAGAIENRPMAAEVINQLPSEEI